MTVLKCPYGDGWEGTPEEYVKHYDDKHGPHATTGQPDKLIDVVAKIVREDLERISDIVRRWKEGTLAGAFVRKNEAHAEVNKLYYGLNRAINVLEDLNIDPSKYREILAERTWAETLVVQIPYEY